MSVAPWEVKRDVLIKAEEETSLDYGCEPSNRPIVMYLRHGVISLDKPPGPTSHDVTATARRILNARYAGHGGTLG